MSSKTERQQDSILSKLHRLFYRRSQFRNSELYWEERYRNGGNSGTGSYNRLAQFKADVLNAFLVQNNIVTTLEFGCGDGNQITLIEYRNYFGFDVSQTSIKLCQKKFYNDQTKKFFCNRVDLLNATSKSSVDLSLSLDVIYHLIEDSVFEQYMRDLFDSSSRYVIIYSSNIDSKQTTNHVKHRKFTNWIEENQLGWTLIKTIPNKYPFEITNPDTSLADFFIYKRISPQ